MQQTLNPERFVRLLTRLTSTDLEALAVSIKTNRDPEDDLDWWQATLALERSLRRNHRLRQAATAAGTAVLAVLAAATRAGWAPDDPDVTLVATAAGETARALVAGDPDLCVFLRSWRPVEGIAGSAPCCPPPRAA
jgi:hypothetical protein